MDYDCLTNKEYKTHIFEEHYVVIVSLIRILSVDIIRFLLKYFNKNFYFNLSARTIRRLRTNILEGNFENFKIIYDEYMQDGITGLFEYGEEGHNYMWNFYLLCECDDWCEKIYRDVYIQRCCCVNGKRYIAFKMIYEEAYEFITIHKSNKSNKKKFQCNNNYQQIVDYIIDSGPIILNYNSMIKYKDDVD
jgi:hypothetical protein